MILKELEDWKLKALPEKHTVIRLNIALTERQSLAVKQGFVPEEMEQKWICYFQANQLIQHRSWTGCCIDIISFEERNNRLVAINARVNRDPEQYSNTDDTEDIKRITDMLKHLYENL
jgi:hypothetical protein